MCNPIDDCLDMLLAPRSIDFRHVALILQPHMRERTQDELVALVAEFAARDGYSYVFEGIRGSGINN